MGGGDLNLKKSWHPSTLRNIERVWKAEQKHEVEKQKIEQLQKELAEERAREEIQAFAEDQGVVRKRDERLDWMYQGPAAMANRDEYLLGRKIDKTFEILEQQEEGAHPKKEDYDVAATMFSSQDLSGTATVDLANKIREDPLFSIMKKEKEQKKNLLCNPVKMKQLQKMLEQSVSGEKKKKKKKKSKKHSDSDSEEKEHKRDQHHKNTLHHKEKQIHKKISKSRESPLHEDSSSKSNFSSSRYEKRHYESYSSRERLSERTSDPSRHFSERRGESHRDRRRDPHENRRTLDDEERDRRLREMQENAKWRDEQRKRSVKRSRESAEKEEQAHKIDAAAFIKPMLSKAAGKGSVENRVKQKIFSIQRSSSEMDKHFARR